MVVVVVVVIVVVVVVVVVVIIFNTTSGMQFKGINSCKWFDIRVIWIVVMKLFKFIDFQLIIYAMQIVGIESCQCMCQITKNIQLKKECQGSG